jgi:hypothetical protein
MLYGTPNHPETLVLVENFKKRQLDKYSNDQGIAIKKYAEMRPFEFPGFEEDFLIGPVVRGRNYSMPESKRKGVHATMFELRSLGNYSKDYLVKLDLFKQGKYNAMDSNWLNVLNQYVLYRWWEFPEFKDHPIIGQIVSVNFSDEIPPHFPLFRNKEKLVEEVPEPTPPIAPILPTDTMVVDVPDEPKRQASTSSSTLTLFTVVATGVALFIASRIIKSNNG